MSHLTANPFQKHFEFPRPGPLTPPDTESEYPNQSAAQAHAPSMGLGIDFEPAPMPHRSTTPATEVPLRKLSSVTYLHSGPREARERVVQRGIRWLVVVIPPGSFGQEHGHFGNTLSVGSPDRLSQGLLMPLFPTMSSQLGAIAREFAFPSTSGLCLYLHTVHGGVSMTPRISDESWQLLWAHLFEARSPTIPPPQLPISGKIEFDIDLSKARWYEAWLGLGRRDFVDVPVSVTPSRAQSVSHWRGDSRTTILDDQGEDQLDSISLLHLARPSRTPGHRHIPRKLSLLDRLESSSIRSGSKLVPRNLSPPSPAEQTNNLGLNALSPIVQEDEPKSGKKDIDRMVNSWRASASLVASPLYATGQTSLDPANLPNSLPIAEDSPVDADAHSELNLDDFAWSVSSLGPPDYDDYEDDEDMHSLESWRLPSVHLDRRLQGSVCLTPTTCTSWGPPDYDIDFSPLSLISRLPSPDLATRMIEDCPATPSTATSWGPDYGLEYSPLSLTSQLPSPDIATRMIEDCPPTPSTATSWGPDYDLEYSPLSITSRLPSPDIATRMLEDCPPTPSTATSWGAPLSWPPSPATPFYVRTPDAGQRAFDVDGPSRPLPSRPEPWHQVWPYNSTEIESMPEEVTEPWKQVWPYHISADQVATTPQTEYGQTMFAQPYSKVWPYYTAAGPSTSSEAESPLLIGASNANAAASAPWDKVWPYNAASTKEPVVVSSPPSYPYLNIYPAVYPFFDLYPTPTGHYHVPKELSVHLKRSYPALELYSPVYPHLEIYPSVSRVSFQTGQVRKITEKHDLPAPVSLKLQTAYPVFDLYPAVYPGNIYNIYPSTELTQTTKATVWLPSKYPSIEIYRHVYPYNLYQIYPEVQVPINRPSIVSSAKWEPPRIVASLDASYPYPHFQIYRPVYPWNLGSIYPPTQVVHMKPQKSLPVQLALHYPVLDIYPAVYPHNLRQIYPDTIAKSEKQKERKDLVNVSLPSRYPSFDLYPPVYPWNLEHIYPAVKLTVHTDSNLESIVVGLPVSYPYIELYAPVYPHNLKSIYPSVIVSAEHRHHPRAPSRTAVSRSAAKPLLRGHNHHHAKRSSGPKLPLPPVPQLPQNLDLMRPINPTSHRPLASARVGTSLPVRLPTFYPLVCPYPPVYPHFDLYPAASASLPQGKQPAPEIALRASYPAIEIYRPVYPHFDLYPTASASLLQSKQPAPEIASRVGYPAIEIYRPVYPHFDLYPAASANVPQGKQPAPEIALRARYPAIEIYRPVYPFIEIYPGATGSEICSPTAPRRKPKYSHLALHQQVFVQPSQSVVRPEQPVVPRRKPKFSHAELHEQVSRPDPESLVEFELVTPPKPTVRFAVPDTPTELQPPLSPRSRQLPPIPQISLSLSPVDPMTPTGASISPIVSISPSPSPRTRSRAGTLTSRPPLPPPPMGALPATPPRTPPSPADSPTRAFRRLPSVPQETAPGSAAQSPVRSVRSSMVGLPSNPAATRRASGVPLSRSPSSFSPLPTVPEPGSMLSTASPTASPVSPRRPLPQPQIPEVPTLELHRSGSASARLSPTPLTESAPDLSRANSLPARPVSRVRRDSVATAPAAGGLVAGMAKAYNSTPKVDEIAKRISMSNTLSQFPTPPRPPLPALPNSRPVSKLDRSKYPFA
ncbi:hypothetical protein PHLCEN_2v10687 [Hermanssonia centrifuga]|uniref:Uncharacterized protein n=1 Tax=Hermanssonia centrifuga TaxID=98765 RepID=A0A2R6NLX7_9APHY|nr:hypothetical protein PHLCEN_2v10687 [Hermanssonia centrifuga]